MGNSIFAFIVYIGRNRNGKLRYRRMETIEHFRLLHAMWRFYKLFHFSQKIEMISESDSRVLLTKLRTTQSVRRSTGKYENSDLAHTQLFNRSVKHIFRLRIVSQAIYYLRINSYAILYLYTVFFGHLFFLVPFFGVPAQYNDEKHEQQGCAVKSIACTMHSLHVHGG